MITTLDSLSWSPELVTGGAQFVVGAQTGFGLDFGHDFGGGVGPSILVVSNVRNDGAGFGEGFGISFGSQYSFVILQSQPTPPASGPGSAFVTVATYLFPQPNTTFDPVAAYDTSGTDPLIHIVGTRNTPSGMISSSSQTNDVIKFTYDTVTNVLTGPIVLSSGTRVRSAYDIAVLPNGNQVVVMSLDEPTIQGSFNVNFVAVNNGIATVSFSGDISPFVPGQWVLLDGFTNASFLNGQIVQVVSANSGEFTFAFQIFDVGFGYDFGGSFGSYSESEDSRPAPYVQPVGNVLLAVELTANNSGGLVQGFGINFGHNFGDSAILPGTATIIDSSPSRTGNQFDGVSLVATASGIELYYQSHPKIITFQDQPFSINFTTTSAGFGHNFGADFGTSSTIWSLPATTLTTYDARYADNRLTVLTDASGNRYLSETYWTQSNHPEGILGNVLVGRKGTGNWTFHPTPGTFAGGSIIQSTLAIAQNGDVSLVYLLQPFNAVSNPPPMLTASYPLHVASVDTGSLNLTDMPGFYNNVNFTWLRGTKSLIDNESEWAIVGEREVLTEVVNETYSVPVAAPFTIQAALHASYYENVGVTYSGGTSLTWVATNPEPGQYTVEQSTGLYTFNPADLRSQVALNYNYVSAIVPVYASLFNVPPIAEITPTAVTLWRGGSYYSTDVRTVTGVALGNGQVTITCVNDFVAGEKIALYGIGTATFLNGTVLTVTSATSAQFIASFSAQATGLGFGYDFGLNFSNYANSDTGFAAELIAGTLIFSAAGSTDADSDAITFFWSENDPNLADVILTSNGNTASLFVSRAAGPTARNFNVGVAAVDLYSDFVTLRHPPLLISNVEVTGGNITVTFAPPGQAGFGSVFGSHFGSSVPLGSVVPVPGEQVMLYGIVLNAPQAPTLGQVSGGTLAAQTNVSVIVTYVNNAGETMGSDNSVINVAANHLLTVTSPGNNGSASGYNVYAGAAGSETLQTLTPQLLGTIFTESTGGLIASFRTPPLTSTALEQKNGALEQALNDGVLIVSSTTATSFTAPFTLAGTFGSDFGNNFNGEYSASLTGFAITQFQWALADVVVPQNVAPITFFPAPQWGAGNVLLAPLPRNAQVVITPDVITNPATQFSIVYTGITDPDDATVFLWTQTSGTPVTLPNGNAGSSLAFNTNGVNVNGETLGFTLTVNDGVNLPTTANFTVTVAAYNFGAARDSLQLSRSIWSQTANVTNVAITSGVATITASNSFSSGEPVRFSGLTGASFLNNMSGFYVSTAGASQFTFATSLPNYSSEPDAGVARATMPIAQRNTPQTWLPLDISVIFSDLGSVKRTSALDGSDRYIVISPYSVLVYAVFQSAVPTAVLLRRLLTPNRTTILDAVHTEQDYTLVLDNAGSIFRYSSASLIDTDNPDTTLSLADITNLSFTDPDLTNDPKILTTQSFANNRIVVLTGEEGALLLQLNTTTLAEHGILEFLTADNLLYGANYIQFVRWVNMDNLRAGQVLLGSVVYQSAVVTQIGIASNKLTVTCANTFSVGDTIVLSGLTNASFLNGAVVDVIAVSTIPGIPGQVSFAASYQYSGTYVPTAEPGSPNSPLAESQNSGTTYETLVDLAQGQIIGTWDKSKLRNQFVQTGEILFTPDTTYSGAPIPPLLAQPISSVVNGQTYVTLSWQQERPDLISSYIVSYAIETQVVGIVPLSAPYTFQIPNVFAFTADEGVVDTASPISINAVIVSGDVVTVTGNNTFSVGQEVKIAGVTGLSTLIGQTLIVSTLIGSAPTYSGFTASFTNANYGLPNTVNQVQVTGDVLTITTLTPHTFSPGTQVTFNSVGTATFLNGSTVTILTTGSTTFTASLTHANYGPTSDTGNVVDADMGYGFASPNQTLVAVLSNPLAGQYTVAPTGLYTFNAAQAGNTETISIRQSFNTLQTVPSGATQSVTVPLASAATYFFTVEAFGLDGSSGLSNIVSISV